MSKVLVRVNMTTAGLGDVGSTYLTEDSAFLRLCVVSGVASIVDETPSGEVENLEPDADDEPVTSTDTPRKARARKTSGGA